MCEKIKVIRVEMLCEKEAVQNLTTTICWAASESYNNSLPRASVVQAVYKRHCVTDLAVSRGTDSKNFGVLFVLYYKLSQK